MVVPVPAVLGGRGRRGGSRPFDRGRRDGLGHPGHPEECHQLLQRFRLARQLFRRRGQLFGRRGVALRHLVHARQGAVDLGHAGGLLGRRRRHFLHRLRRPPDRRHQLGQQLARSLGDLHAGAGEPADLLGGRLAALGELADFGRDDREAAAVLPGARRFDRGIERQEVRLIGDLFHDRDFLGDRFHRVHGFDNGLAAVFAVIRRLQRALFEGPAVVGVLGDRSTHLLQAGRSLLDRGGLLARALRQPLRRRRDLRRRRAEGIGAHADFADHLRQLVDHALERLPQCVSVGLRRDFDRQVTLGDPHGGVDLLFGRADHPAHRFE